MGGLIDGVWLSGGRKTVNGAYLRPNTSIRTATNAVSQAAMHTAGRVWLIASHSCPWSHRATITHQLKGLSGLMPVHYAHGPRQQGYSLNGQKYWRIPGTSIHIQHLHELYSYHDNHFSGSANVPLLWDSETGSILSNESSDIVPGFDSLLSPIVPNFTLRPPTLVQEIDKANEMIYHGLNNAVYRAGFAQKQSVYDEAVQTVFNTLDFLEERLTCQRYYFGSVITETDVRIFPTLIRFDAIYYILFKCSKRRISDYPALFQYTQDFFQLPGVGDTVNFETMRTASYLTDSDSPNPIVAVQPDTDWEKEHFRSNLGPAEVAMHDGSVIQWR